MPLRARSPLAGLILTGLLIAVILGLQFSVPEETLSISDNLPRVDPVSRPLAPSDGYVGGDACRRCHQAIWERYQSHPMSQSAAECNQASPVESFGVHPAFLRSSSLGEIAFDVERTASGQTHVESLTDATLGVIYNQRVPMTYSIGSGRHGRSYVFQRDESLFMSPLTWYSEHQKWDLSPGYQPVNDLRFERRITLNCIICHTDQINANRDDPNRFDEHAIPRTKISCERCHGPGTEHIAFQETRTRSPSQSVPGDDPIVNPIKLDPVRRESVCWQCHLGGDNRIPRHGRVDSDFRPGMKLNDVWIQYGQHGSSQERGAGRVANHVEQIRASTCFNRSEGRFGCTSCHDAHSVPARGEAFAYYRQKCIACHEEQGCSESIEKRIAVTKEDSCITCHMPSGGVAGVPHTSRTDHRILRHPDVEASPASKADPVLALWKEDETELPPYEVDRAWGLIFAKLAYLRKSPDLAHDAIEKLTRLQSLMPDDVPLLEWLGASEFIIGRNNDARSRWNEILRRVPDHEESLRWLADLAMTEGNRQAARDAVARYLKVNPWQSEYQLRLAVLYAETGNVQAAVASTLESIKVNPASPASHRVLAELYRLQGNLEASQRERQIVDRLIPK